ncbi:MAG TPA: response regulator [Patescibacteria group bacterium]|nr:response regulator [Patescibacteria group bacterium]
MNAAWPTVLHVEDNLGDKELLQHACQAASVPCNLQWVEDGQAAMDYLAGIGPCGDRDKFPLPSLMLLDLKMPRKNGFEVLEWLRQQKDLKWLPVIVFTASDSQKDIRRAFELGANSLVVKPTAYRDLVEYVKGFYRYWFELNQRPGP